MRLLFVAIVLCADGQLLSCTTFLRISGQGTLLTRYLLEVAACLRKPSRKLPTIFFLPSSAYTCCWRCALRVGVCADGLWGLVGIIYPACIRPFQAKTTMQDGKSLVYLV
ncbi:hypothetical protein F4824DRAFT_41242 [Ustulina deusta]|nr:hypothetical protein F4824DRAFT_41242 [Ustulina deusta]